MSEVKNNTMTAPRPADDEAKTIFRAVKKDVLDEISRSRQEDDRGGYDAMDKLQSISEYTLVLYATEDVAYGRNYFGKIHLGDEKYVHARAHKTNSNEITFNLLMSSPGCAVWDKDTPLKYFA